MKKIFLIISMLCTLTSFAGEHLTMSGPATLESCPMMLMAEENALSVYGVTAEFIPWTSPDQYRAMLSSEKNLYVIVSTLEYVRLNKLIENARLLFSVEGSPIWFLGKKTGVTLKELESSIIALPFRGDMPEILLMMLMEKSGNDYKKTKIVSAGGGITSAQLVMRGRADYVAIPEPIASSIVEISGRKGLRKLSYSLSVEKIWRELYQSSPPLLVSNIMSFKSSREADDAFRKTYSRYYGKCVTNAEVSANLFVKYFPAVSKSGIKQLISSNNIKIHTANEITEQLNEFIRLMDKQIKNEF
ncbi:hypothetical protein Dacet_2075 [Denitrovibrio acetiphilus DSM 12809]|uniref:ABC transporter substrate-binding protein n=1 Tax=Denitrovibrio acetiphilus (strain DSM 12809 / NBRC 114555 / N2460) TaxID=522772 RepID=D4H1S8_DENA2|nr:hypothetical protein [Denitrovibrio acetiphilus]ADD68838.1 hypothetical protein Dacet_2075 [Denitrovibrio acetiphilus DSM 12809]